MDPALQPPSTASADAEPYNDNDLAAAAEIMDTPGAVVDHVLLTQLVDAGRAPVAAALRFAITNTGQAEWAARKWREAKAEVDAATEQVAEWDRLNHLWLMDVTKGPLRKLAWMEALLKNYGLAYRADTGKATVKLPSATVGTTQHKPAIKLVADKADDFVAWALEEADRADLFIKTTHSPKLAVITGAMTIADVYDGQTLTVALDCGHSYVVDLPAEGDTGEGVVPTGDQVACHQGDCYDRLDGGTTRTVTTTFLDNRYRKAAVWVLPQEGDNGEVQQVEPPGLMVTPVSTTASVRP